MDLLQNFGADPELVEKGAWVKLVPGDPDSGEVLLGRLWSPAFKEAFQKATDKLMAKKPEGYQTTPKDDEHIMCKALSEATLLGWRNLSIDGKELKYSKKKAYDLLRDERLRDFADLVVAESNTQANYRLKSLESNAGK